jgi:hypothetical protein
MLVHHFAGRFPPFYRPLLVTVALFFMAYAVILPRTASARNPLNRNPLNKEQSNNNDKGSVCLGVYAPKIIQNDELKRVYVTVGNSGKIFFDQQPGTMVLSNLDLHKTYVVRVFYDSRQVDSWKLSFDRLGVNLVTIWRSAGYWHMDPSPSGKCLLPPKNS